MAYQELEARQGVATTTDFWHPMIPHSSWWLSLSDSDSVETLWPPPAEETTDSTKRKKSKSSDTEEDEPTDAVVTEESIITTNAMTTKVDSGKTVTVPNSEIVTITRHTTILTDRPPSSTPALSDSPSTLGPSPGVSEQTAVPPPTESGQGEDGNAGIPTGAIIGIGVGGAALVAFLVIMAIVIKRRRQKRRDEQDATAPEDDFGRDDRYDEKHFPQQMSAHTTGTQASGDPFAPFGGLQNPSTIQYKDTLAANNEAGRVDQDSDYPNRPQSNTFEMDATSAAPVELPDTSPAVTIGKASEAVDARQFPPIPDNGPKDPRANLDSLGVEDGKPKYVNHWNQYRAMSSS